MQVILIHHYNSTHVSNEREESLLDNSFDQQWVTILVGYMDLFINRSFHFPPLPCGCGRILGHCSKLNRISWAISIFFPAFI